MVAAYAFFVCKLVLLLIVAANLRLLVAATLQLLVAATLWLLVAATLRLLVAATLQLIVCSLFAALCVQRVCRPSCRLFLMGEVWNLNNKLSKKQCREKLCVTHMSKLVGTHAILQVYHIFLVWHEEIYHVSCISLHFESKGK